jgi:hypothetical protein
MKLCVICYVLLCACPTTATSRASNEVGVPDDHSVGNSVQNPVSTSSGDGSNSGDHTDSPYLRSLFPHLHPHNATSAKAVSLIDSSTPACVGQLQVHPVTALVRRLPCPASTYQTVGQIQAQYRSASTAHKGGAKGAKNAKKQDKKDSRKPRGNEKRDRGNDKKDANSADSGGMVVDGERHAAPTEATLDGSDAAGAKLSSRQQRIAKYLLKQQQGEGQGAHRHKGSLDKARRDHRENRFKTMSHKNQSLLDALGAGVTGSGQSGTSGAGAACEIGIATEGASSAAVSTAPRAVAAAGGDVADGVMGKGPEDTVLHESGRKRSPSAAGLVDELVTETRDSRKRAKKEANEGSSWTERLWNNFSCTIS